MKKLIPYIVIYISIFSCEEKKDLVIQSRDIPRLVVDGMITNERTRHKVKLSLPVEELNQDPVPVSGALVAITDQNSVFLLEEDTTEPGTYLTQPDVQGVTGKIYTLYIRIREFEFVANSYMVPVEALRDPIIVPCENKQNYYHIIPEEGGDPYMLRITGNWSDTEDCGKMEGCSSVTNHYHLNSIDINQNFKPDKEIICFPVGSVITREKYSLNPQHQEFIRSLLMETEWRGSIFDVERGNVITNVSAGGIGYFAASTMVRDTFVLK